jgi:hypothetical protein
LLRSILSLFPSTFSSSFPWFGSAVHFNKRKSANGKSHAILIEINFTTERRKSLFLFKLVNCQNFVQWNECTISDTQCMYSCLTRLGFGFIFYFSVCNVDKCGCNRPWAKIQGGCQNTCLSNAQGR